MPTLKDYVNNLGLNKSEEKIGKPQSYSKQQGEQEEPNAPMFEADGRNFFVINKEIFPEEDLVNYQALTQTKTALNNYNEVLKTEYKKLENTYKVLGKVPAKQRSYSSLFSIAKQQNELLMNQLKVKRALELAEQHTKSYEEQLEAIKKHTEEQRKAEQSIKLSAFKTENNALIEHKVNNQLNPKKAFENGEELNYNQAVQFTKSLLRTKNFNDVTPDKMFDVFNAVKPKDRKKYLKFLDGKDILTKIDFGEGKNFQSMTEAFKEKMNLRNAEYNMKFPTRINKAESFITKDGRVGATVYTPSGKKHFILDKNGKPVEEITGSEANEVKNVENSEKYLDDFIKFGSL